MSYCILEHVQTLNPKRNYNTDSTPSVTQVNALIDQVAVEIDSILQAQGYTVPVTTPDNFVSFLQYVNAYGAAALAEAGMFPETTDPGQTAHWQMLNKKYEGWLGQLRKGEIPSSLAPGTSSADVASYYTQMGDQDDYPDPPFRMKSEDLEF